MYIANAELICTSTCRLDNGWYVQVMIAIALINSPTVYTTTLRDKKEPGDALQHYRKRSSTREFGP